MAEGKENDAHILIEQEEKLALIDGKLATIKTKAAAAN